MRGDTFGGDKSEEEDDEGLNKDVLSQKSEAKGPAEDGDVQIGGGTSESTAKKSTVKSKKTLDAREAQDASMIVAE